MRVSMLILMSLMACGVRTPDIEIDGQTFTITFQDEFNGKSLDTEKWDYRTDSKHWSTQKKENVEVKDGLLYLNLKKEKSNGMEYTGSGIISKDRYQYGYYETRMKVSAGAGWHNSFWLMEHDGSGGTATKAANIEIDIIENDSSNPLDYGICFHRWKGEHITKGCTRVETPDMSKDFQVVSCIYTSEYVKFFLNGKELHKIDISEMPKAAMNIWLTSIASWLGNTEAVDDSQLPSSVVFDYVWYYSPK